MWITVRAQAHADLEFCIKYSTELKVCRLHLTTSNCVYCDVGWSHEPDAIP